MLSRFIHWIPQRFLRWREAHRSRVALRALSLRVADILRNNGWGIYVAHLGWDAETPSPEELLNALVTLHHQLHGRDIRTSSALVDGEGESSRFYDEGLGEIVDSLKHIIDERT